MADYGLGGFFPQLKTARDLFEKLKWNLVRLEAAPRDAREAYDFFVTANHLVDWQWPDDPARRKEVRDRDVIPRICEHLANGAKHFSLGRHHDAVQHANVAPPAFAPDAFGAGFSTTEESIVQLGPTERAALGQDRINVVDLARQAVQYWQSHVGSSEPL
jgi:hypothetical protein